MKRIITALLVLIVTLCAAFVVAQGGEVDNLDDPQSPPAAPATPPQGGTGIAPTPCSAEATASLYFAAADARAKRAQAETASVRATANQANSGIRRLDGELKGVREDTNKLNDTVYGAKDKDGKRSGGLAMTTQELVEWKNQLIAENGDLWWLAAKKGEIGKAIAITSDAAAFFTAAKEAGYNDGSGRFNAGKFVTDV